MEYLWLIILKLLFFQVNSDIVAQSFQQPSISSGTTDVLNNSDAEKSCKKILGQIGKEGSIEYNRNHRNHFLRKCWIIHLPRQQLISINVSYLNMHTFEDRCNCLSFLGFKSLSNHIDINRDLARCDRFNKFCGNKTPPLMVFYTNSLLINFTSYQDAAEGHVFNLTYSIDKEQINKLNIGSYNYITSPGYPNPISVQGVTYSWQVTLQNSQLPLEFYINEWQGDDDSTSFYVYDGSSNKDNLILKWSGGNLPPAVESSGQSIFVEFIAENSDALRRILFNCTVKAKGYCLPGTFSCGNQKDCYTTTKACDGVWDCPSGNDELGCDKCESHLYVCGPLPDLRCYSKSQRCDGKEDCQLDSKQLYGDEYGCDICAPGSFRCNSTATGDDRCIFERWRCDGEADCDDKSDEIGCSYSASRKVITAAIIGSLVCGLLLAVALGCSCKLYTLRSSSYLRERRERLGIPTPVGRLGRLLGEREAPPSYMMTVEGVEQTESNSSRSSSGRQRRRRRRRRNREPHIRRAQPAPRPTSTNSESNNRADVVASDGPSDPPASVTCVTSTNAESNLAASSEQSTSVHIPSEEQVLLSDVADIDIREATNVERRSCSQTPTSNDVATTSSGGSSNADQQAPSLPKKKRIPPVRVEAPCDEVAVDDIPGCVYPNPPSYSEALLTGGANPAYLLPVVENESSLASSGDDVKSPWKKMNRFWSKQSPKKNIDFWKFPASLQNIFGLAPSSPRFHELIETGDSTLEENPDTNESVTAVEEENMSEIHVVRETEHENLELRKQKQLGSSRKEVSRGSVLPGGSNIVEDVDDDELIDIREDNKDTPVHATCATTDQVEGKLENSLNKSTFVHIPDKEQVFLSDVADIVIRDVTNLERSSSGQTFASDGVTATSSVDIPGCMYPNPPPYSEALLPRGAKPASLLSTIRSESSLSASGDSVTGQWKKTNHLLTKQSPKKNTDFWKFPASLQNIFGLAPSSPRFHELIETGDSTLEESPDANESVTAVEEENMSEIHVIRETEHENLELRKQKQLGSSRKEVSRGSVLPGGSNIVDDDDDDELIDIREDNKNTPVLRLHRINPMEVKISCGTNTNDNQNTFSSASAAPPSRREMPEWSDPVRVTIPPIRVETPEQLLTLNITGCISERT